jgi:hypothetical protein
MMAENFPVPWISIETVSAVLMISVIMRKIPVWMSVRSLALRGGEFREHDHEQPAFRLVALQRELLSTH